ncbi:2-amino-4-hydroxy-6-hydroxymethyldihydropteridine diphosphokinase [Virgibacillus sp. C22-A2]|uniref:2-amino-4-hydroxy-6-hydroxymethyldihydropteridine diphosphokinase n=1 Tax=Virgibacillus tibetensis TaxID=3042313 RepID=A0ABU6KLH2_9BACI|nr:2-amino-4-hydroxy-6-hydroxymethyldihydropteridine diphosphokinase [Virgibacillus sp. C22-A2]
MNIAYVALGTNIEPRDQHIANALELVSGHEHIRISKKSSIYQTAPVGYTDQADFLNMVIEIETSLSSLDLLGFCQKIERELGRKREIRFGPRTIDLDILVYNQENSETERLTIPHPRMHERAFVLIPLNELAPNLIISANGNRKSVADYIDRLSEREKKDVVKWIRNESGEE